METKFEIKYKETQEVLTKICGVYDMDKTYINIRLFLMILVPFVAALMMVYGNPGGGTPSGLAVFLLKVLVVWIAVYFLSGILAKTIGKKVANLSAAGDGEEMYNRRKKMRKGADFTVRMCFEEECFRNITKTLEKTYYYKDVTRLLETDDAMAIVVRQPSGEKGLYGFPKDAFVEGDADALRSFLEAKCQGAKKGFIKM